MNKKEAREAGLRARDQMNEKTRSEKSRMIFRRLIPYLEKADSVGCYLSMRTEVDTHMIFDYCLSTHKEITAPFILDRKLQFMEVSDRNHFRNGIFGTKEPYGGSVISVKDLDLMIVPLSSFDEENNRTGYGKGYYDSILSDCPLKIGIAFAEQKIDHIDADPWDVELDAVIYA